MEVLLPLHFPNFDKMRGGEVVVAGTPEQVAGCKRSFTGQFLKKIL